MVTIELTCDNCDWEDEVQKADEESADVAASAKAAAHISTNDCPHGSTNKEVADE